MSTINAYLNDETLDIDPLLEEACSRAPTSAIPMVSLLTITLAAKARLPSRPELFECTRQALSDQFGPERAARILVGLG